MGKEHLTSEFDNLTTLLKHFDQLIDENLGDDESWAKNICEYTRYVHMSCALAVFNEDQRWKPKTTEKVERAMRKAIKASSGTIYQKNIAERARAIRERKKRSFTWRFKPNVKNK